MVFVTGDCHADFSRFTTKNFPEQKSMTRDDIVIVCGDFGGIWNDTDEERYWLKWLSKKSFTLVFVDGNHENFDRLYTEFPVVDFHGGKAHKIKNNIYHLMRGYVFDFEGKKFWCFGGASSHDICDGILDPNDFETNEEFVDEAQRWYREGKYFRINHLSWWKEELPSQEEMDFGLKTLEENEFKVDYVISHCAPVGVHVMMGYRDPDKLTAYFNEVVTKLDFKKWYFGHYHQERQVMCKYVCLYYRIERVL